MSEITLQWIAGLKLLTAVCFAMLYGFGGVNGKWKRRIVGSAFLTTAIVGFNVWTNSFNWWLLLCYPLYYGSLTVGYGGVTGTKDKIIKRSRAGFLVGLAALPIAIVHGSWSLFGLHISLCVLISTVLGVWNITDSARSEETLIAITYATLPLFL